MKCEMGRTRFAWIAVSEARACYSLYTDLFSTIGTNSNLFSPFAAVINADRAKKVLKTFLESISITIIA
jgi:hypothetical protein